MSEDGDALDEKQFCVERAKQGRATCKKCKQKCLAGELRLAKIVPNPFGDGKMKSWHHVHCLFEQFLKQRPTTKRIESVDDIDGFDGISGDDQREIEGKIEEYAKLIAEKYNISPRKTKSPKAKTNACAANSNEVIAGSSTKRKNDRKTKNDLKTDDDSMGNETLNSESNYGIEDYAFRDFRRLVADITNVSAYTDKTEIVKKMFTKGKNVCTKF